MQIEGFDASSPDTKSGNRDVVVFEIYMIPCCLARVTEPTPALGGVQQYAAPSASLLVGV